MKIIQVMDKRWNLWQDEEANENAAASAGKLDKSVNNGNNGNESIDKDDSMNKESAGGAGAGTSETDYAKLEEIAFNKLLQSDISPIKHKVKKSTTKN